MKGKYNKIYYTRLKDDVSTAKKLKMSNSLKMLRENFATEMALFT